MTARTRLQGFFAAAQGGLGVIGFAVVAAFLGVGRAQPPEPAGVQADQEIAALETSIARLQQRLARLQDTDEIENLNGIYGYYLDKNLWDQLADLFAEDGAMEISFRGIYVGKKSIRRALELFGPQNIRPGQLNNHVEVQPVIDVSADGVHAWARSRTITELGVYDPDGTGAVRGPPGGGGWSDAVYENEYVKDGGAWKIKRMRIYPSFYVTYDKGWPSGALPGPGVSERIPPDRPPSAVFEYYPGEYVPPFHYKHPVTGADIVVPPALQVKPIQRERQ